jgi:hypothetical protein
MATYSIGLPPTDATKLEDIISTLGILPDNTTKLISPKDVRDAVYTLWENIIFKPTLNTSGIEYVGIDQTNYAKKILFGKKIVNNTNVLNNALLNTDVDTFFYNTKTASGNHDTKIAFLAGTGSNMVGSTLVAPYLHAREVDNPPYTKTINLEIINPSYYVAGTTTSGGDITIQSENGFLILNGIRWPTYNNNLLSTQNDYVLKYKTINGFPYAIWEASTTASITSLSSTGTISISGSPVLINGFPIQFSDSLPTPTAFGGIPAGSTFSNEHLTEIIRRMLYPYIAPRLTTFLSHTLIEIGDATTLSSFRLNWQIIKNSTYSIIQQAVLNPPAHSGTLPNNITTNGTFTGQITPLINYGPLTTGTTSWQQNTFTFSIVDTFPTSATSATSMKFVIPWYYGTTTQSATQSTGSPNINQLLGTASNISGKLIPLLTEPALSTASIYNKTVLLSTLFGSVNQGYIYFGYPSDFPDLLRITDQNGFDVTSAFNKFTFSGVDSPFTTGRWFGKSYKFYIYVGPSSSQPQLTTINSQYPYAATYSFLFS